MGKSKHECDSDEKWHEDNHLCRVILQGDLDKIKKLVVDPKYICKNCGRIAHSNENICKVMKL